MSVELAEKIGRSRESALDKGTVIKLRKEDVLKTKILGYSQGYDYTWYQTPTKVGIEIPYSVERREDLKLEFHQDRLTVNFPLPKNGGTFQLDLTLFKRIIKARSVYYLRLNGLEIVMEKKVPSENWTSLRRDGLGIPESLQRNELGYPSSARMKHNWDKFDREIAEDINEHYEDYGLDAG
jgi:hypothetical protein